LIRFIAFLLGKQYEPCKGCEILKQQITFVNDEKKQLSDVLLSIVRPQAVESTPVEFKPITTTASVFSRRRAVLEARDREEAKILKDSNNLGKPDDSIRELEHQLGIEEEKEA
jgi:hypothetical protein